MKALLLSTLLTLPFALFAQKNPAADTIRQAWHAEDKKQPTADEVLLKVIVFNLARNKMANVEVRAVEKNSGRVWLGTTGAAGSVYFLVPKGNVYRIDAGDETGIDTLRVADEGYTTESVSITYMPNRFSEEEHADTITQKVSAAQTPTRNRLLAIVNMLDLDNRPLEGEELFFSAQKAGKVYTARTDPAGKARLMLPLGDSYCFSTRFEARLKCYDLPVADRPGQLTITYNTIGTREILRRRAERARAAALADSLYRTIRTRDSLDALRRGDWERRGMDDFVHQLMFGGAAAAVRQRIEARAAAERDSVARDPRYFEKNGEAVKATLYRMRERWKNKVIVTDLTGSMSPYMDQIVLWHALQLVQGEENRYLFFNDGDAKSDSEKRIGQTGGIYFTEKGGMDSLLSTMKKTALGGYGGDTPENDLEALLAGARKMHGLDELILVADNNSDVRDLELLDRLKVPVHVILCGTGSGVNENYLEIAYKTKGSVHTIEQDIEDLTRLADGATIDIGGFRYRVSRGKFIQVSRI